MKSGLVLNGQLKGVLTSDISLKGTLNDTPRIKARLRSAPVGGQLFWFGTRDEYNALKSIDSAVCYCIEEGT